MFIVIAATNIPFQKVNVLCENNQFDPLRFDSRGSRLKFDNLTPWSFFLQNYYFFFLLFEAGTGEVTSFDILDNRENDITNAVLNKSSTTIQTQTSGSCDTGICHFCVCPK